MDDELLTLPRMARRLGVTQRWLREQADVGRVPHLRADNRYLFAAHAVQAELAKQAAEKPDDDNSCDTKNGRRPRQGHTTTEKESVSES